jgi:hypothetical protein
MNTLLPARDAETPSGAVACNSYTADGPVIGPIAGFSAFLSGLAHHHGHPQPRDPADPGQRAGACFDHNADIGLSSARTWQAAEKLCCRSGMALQGQTRNPWTPAKALILGSVCLDSRLAGNTPE